MPYIADEHRRPSSDELRARIPGWGADLDPADRPSVPRERTDLPTGAHWVIPENQPELQPRERSIEHAKLPPVFGTSAPLHGVSGVVRRYAYERFSEARAAHWLLLIVGDRIDVAGSRVRSVFEGQPDNPITETGIRAEFGNHPIGSRFGRGRADTKHAWIDPLIVIGPTALATVAVALIVRGLRR
ncbi:hypothetical protein GCM10027413_29870 [Conyzicola nivalis]|uniref:Uncharacterized protein n=1 Tax=Conyzicola nivalis TaxID=1477021 RepID=A0A916STN9_9MICO|nr:hypothetical protein [Conyzicola nivalis]GGB13278.1 hypothetical protein GCM10010979_29640 [Conyzicola nivalis]